MPWAIALLVRKQHASYVDLCREIEMDGLRDLVMIAMTDMHNHALARSVRDGG